MILTVTREACPTCGAFCYYDDPIDGLTCLLCSRPLHPYVSDAPYIANERHQARHDGRNQPAREPERPVVSLEDVRAAREAVR